MANSFLTPMVGTDHNTTNTSRISVIFQGQHSQPGRQTCGTTHANIEREAHIESEWPTSAVQINRLTLTTTFYSPSHLDHIANENLSQPESTRPSHTLVRSLHLASQCEPQQVVLDPHSLFFTFRHRLCCASLLLTPAPFPGASPLLSQRHTRSRRVTTPRSQTSDGNLVFVYFP